MADFPAFKELIQRVRAGDADAARLLVERYGPAVRRAARVRLRDERLRRLMDSADVVQSVFGSFFARAAAGQYDLRGPADLLNLLADMARKKLVDRARREQAACRDYRRAAGGAVVTGLADPTPGPDEQASARELLLRVRDRLSRDEQRLAELRAEGQSWAEIGARFRRGPEALRKQLARAVSRVARELGLQD